MAKIVNTFVKGKLNKDLDARLVPNGEYRDARNIQVSKSEGPDVGELENVLGNELLFDFATDIQLTNLSNKCIGYLADESNSNIYLFITSYTDPAPQQITYNKMAENAIVRYNTQDPIILGNNPKKLVEGNFLNFSTTNPIYGVNLLEGLLYWTDNRNQPRVINLDKAEAEGLTYYTSEDQISVAKYNPWQAIQLFQESALGGAGTYETTMKDVTSLFLPNGGSVLCDGAWDGNSAVTGNLVSDGQGVFPPVLTTIYYEDATGSIVSTGSVVAAGSVFPQLNASPTLGAPLPDGTKLIFNPNPYYDKNFAGDPSYLEDLFVRFSYRYRYEDNEYSLMAPFTQIAFIPKQDGYFLYVKQNAPRLSIDDQSDAYRSTVVQFVENKVDDIKLIFNLPYTGDTLRDSLKIKEMEILFKESDGVAIKIIDTITIDEIENQAGTTSVFTYDYLSKKPFKVLTTAESTRVSDQIPVRAFSQEISGNRVIYGNFQNKHTPPKFIDYNVGVSEKDTFNLLTGTATVDGDQNNVPPGTTILLNAGSWTPFLVGSDILVGSEVYNAAGDLLFIVASLVNPNDEITADRTVSLTNGEVLTFRPIGADTTTTSIIEYPNSTLKQNRNYQVGIVLSDRFGRQSSVILSENDTISTIGQQSFIGDTVYNAYLDPSVEPEQWPGDSLKVLFNSTIGPSSFNRATLEPGLYNGNRNSSFYNPLGWYSYKIVVKQTEQEYYNVYLPGIMAAYPEDLILEENATSHTVLINDNINKVPRDLTEVGPDQKQYRSSVQLFGRVENTANELSVSGFAGLPFFTDVGEANTQYYPEIKADTVSTISVVQDLFDFNPIDPPRPNFFPQFYLLESNPSIARISTQKKIGQVANTNYSASPPPPNIPHIGSGRVVTGATVPAGVLIPLNNINGVLELDQVASSPGIPDGIYVTNVNPAVNPTEIALSEEVTLVDDQLIELAPGYPTPNQGELYLPGIQFLSVYETSPFVSNLDIYWETTSSGLISDLNSLIINSTEGAAGVDGDNFSGWNEGLQQPTLPGTPKFISNTNFFPVDAFGVAIDPADITGMELLSATDQDNNLRTNYFELFGAVGNPFGLPSNAAIPAGQFNISITQDYYDNVYFTAAPGNDRLFNFYLKVTTNVSGVATLNFEFIAKGPQNVDPSFTISPGAAVVNTDRQDTSNLFTFTGDNGADNNNLNSLPPLECSITNIQKTFNGVVTQINQQAEINETFTISNIDVTPPDLVTALSIADSSIDPGNYVATVVYQDAGDSFSDQVAINFDRTPTVVQFLTDIYTCYDNDSDETSAGTIVPTTVLLIEINGSPIAAQDGSYLYKGNLNSIANGTNNVITINANQAGDPSVSCLGQLFYSSTQTLTQLRNSFTSNDCISGGGDCGSNSGWSGPSPVDISGYTVEIIGTP